jgi:hypothetical protein
LSSYVDIKTDTLWSPKARWRVRIVPAETENPPVRESGIKCRGAKSPAVAGISRDIVSSSVI